VEQLGEGVLGVDQHGRAVTFERVLDELDAMATAIRRGVAFASPLRPAAGDASMRHRP